MGRATSEQQFEDKSDANIIKKTRGHYRIQIYF